MTKKHFEAFARYIRNHSNRAEAQVMAAMIVAIAQGDRQCTV